MLEFKKAEEEILKFWEKEKIYEKIKKRNSKGKKFYFLQGPPYTSGKLHIGHAWNNALKDIILRYKRMQGFDVWDRAGYDMHGLPTENKVQKNLGFKFKEQIEEYGVDKFVKECMKFSEEHAEMMNKDLWKLGIWMDYENAYMPIKKEYIEGEWLLFKKAWEQGRLYKGKKIMHWDADSETSLAKHELEYETIKDMSIFLKFLIKGKKNEYIVIWTTTPWTIPYNLAVMANPELDYVKIKVDNEYWIVAKALAGLFVSSLLGKKLDIVEEFKGDKLEGLEYVHPLHDELEDIYDSLKKKWKKVHTVILSKEYVDTTAGSGLVHCAPGCGPEDFEVGKANGMDAFNTLDERGIMQDLGKYTGMKAKTDDNKFIEEFEKKKCLIAKTEIEHEYPLSWRSHKPVVFRATEQWFLKIEDLVPGLLKYNKKVSWTPERVRESYDKWTSNLRDNGVTRQRFWGCPAPIWTCKCGNVEVIGDEKELSKKAGKNLSKLELHKPWIDEVKIKCTKCKSLMSRIPDVIDVWIDSGTAGWNCLYNDPKLIKKYFPADLVLEATEQTKLWFNMLQICSAITLGKSCYENVFVHGMILDYQGTKMSKSIGNIISPYEVVDKYSADILRYYICQTTAGENISFNWEDIKAKQGNLNMLSNIANYILDLEKQKIEKGKQGIEEEWILSKYNSTLKEVTELFESYKIDETIGAIEKLIVSLSKDYIKLVRDKATSNSSVLESVKEVYIGILKMFSTICPFITESLWQKLGEKDSVHLASWPKVDKKKIDLGLEKEFQEMMKIIELGLSKRDEVKIGLKWPLSKALINYPNKIEKSFEEIIARQLNVKSIKVTKKEEIKVDLDTKMTPELEAEGYSREFARNVQAARKKQGLQRGDLIVLKVHCDSKTREKLEENINFLTERTNSKKIDFTDDKIENPTSEFSIKESKISVKFS
jgi:isoleucyl-tRNA synthetase